jgi:hypothetical protein
VPPSVDCNKGTEFILFVVSKEIRGELVCATDMQGSLIMFGFGMFWAQTKKAQSKAVARALPLGQMEAS